jgi:thiamine biosynthesis lipoprotein
MTKLYQETAFKLGSQAIVSLVCQTDSQAEEIFRQIWLSIDQFENRFSRFKKESELSKYNLDLNSKLSPPFQALLDTSLELEKETEGIFTPFVLEDMQKIGYSRSFELLSDNDNSSPAEYFKIHSLDFGGIGKGYLLDQLHQELSPTSMNNYWISLGGDLIFVGQDETRNWQASIQNPVELKGDYLIFEIPQAPLAVATSGTQKRRGIHKGQAWHHLIDPRTRQSAETDLISATVIGPSATRADVFASVCVILGLEKGRQFIATKDGYQAVLFLDPNKISKDSQQFKYVQAKGTPKINFQLNSQFLDNPSS